MEKATRFVLYARKSSEREDRQVQSIDDQITYWQRKALEEGIEIVKIYTEEKSAKAPWVRKAFYEMCTEIETWNIDGILCWKLDRLARNPVDAGQVQFMLQRHKLKRIITSDRIYQPEDSWLIFSVEAGMANQYILDLSKNVRRWLKSKIEKGHFPAKAPQGYINDPFTRTITPDPEKFQLVRKMWDMLLTWCYAPSQIAHTANTEWWYSTVNVKYKARRELAISTLYAMFRNPFYTWYMKYNKNTIKWSHEPMITWEEFEKAQKIICHTSGSPNKVYRERPSTLSFPYTGNIRCWCCGCMVTAVKKYKNIRSTGKEREYTYYHCTHKKNTPEFRCDQRKVVSNEWVEKQIEEILNGIEIIPEFFNWSKEVLNRKYSEESTSRESIKTNIANTLESAEKKKTRLLHMRLAWEFENNYKEYDRMRLELEKEIEQLQIRKTEIAKELIDWTELITDTINFSKYASERFRDWDLETKKLIFRALGWNWILMDQKLQANLHDWFLPFIEFNKLQHGYIYTLELTEKSISYIKTDALTEWFTLWWGYLGLNQGPIGYEPTALTTELYPQKHGGGSGIRTPAAPCSALQV